ncbi:MAG: hypothetical protein OXG82_06090 [Gammaproteobacteria bacterium]|nr:hypothetical protein [Gammaproteobacteria bacterium]
MTASGGRAPESAVGKHLAVARIVVDGAPARTNRRGSNVAGARRMLLQARAHRTWGKPASFAMTPGGFLQYPFPADYAGRRGWRSRDHDFRALARWAQAAVDEFLTPRVLAAARPAADYLTLGVDLHNDVWKGEALRTAGLAAELVAIVETASAATVHWTGKSYPTPSQERMLVREPDLDSHRFECRHGRILVLGCHDLNMFSNRSRSRLRPGTPRSVCWHEMNRLAGEFAPTAILHHPHSTDSRQIWSVGWSGARRLLPTGADGRPHVWASAIAYYNRHGARQALGDVLEATACCSRVAYVVVAGDG